uniref:Uncharacterized protein n=1 Tax=Fagus sylvatica TaxID=28930 RepID=A0A2N9J7Y1_FAGSY
MVLRSSWRSKWTYSRPSIGRLDSSDAPYSVVASVTDDGWTEYLQEFLARVLGAFRFFFSGVEHLEGIEGYDGCLREGKLDFGSVPRTFLRDSLIGTRDSRSTRGNSRPVSGSSRVVGPDDLLGTARSYLSKVVDVDGLDKYRRKYQIPEDVVLRIPESDEIACFVQPLDEGAVGSSQPRTGSIRPQMPGGQVVGSMVMWKVLSDREGRPYPRTSLLFCYKPCQIPASPGFLDSEHAAKGLETLRRPKLGSDGHNRGMATAKLNREKLKKMMMSPAGRGSVGHLGRRGRLIRRPRRWQMREVSLLLLLLLRKPSIPEPVPTSSIEVVEIPCRTVVQQVRGEGADASTRTLPWPVKSGQGLTELTVIANRCMQWEEALLKQKVQMSEAAQANQRLTTLVNELTLDRDRVVGELSTLKADLTRKDEEPEEGVGRRKERQAKEKFPELDFDAFQPFDDDESTMPADEGNVEILASDPQMDDDATS